MKIKDTHIITSYHFIDDDRCISPLSAAIYDGGFSFGEKPKTEPELRYELSELFLNAGWEGDGEINCIIIPPFIYQEDMSDGHCEVVYHVKQDNNGTSWLAIPKNVPHLAWQ